jgi:hypothetical protein
MVVADTSTSSSNGIGEAPATDGFQRDFNLARMPFVTSRAGAPGLSIAGQPEDPKIINPPDFAFAEHLILLFRDRPVAIGQIHQVRDGSILKK